jgi:hypothetical protein
VGGCGGAGGGGGGRLSIEESIFWEQQLFESGREGETTLGRIYLKRDANTNELLLLLLLLR